MEWRTFVPTTTEQGEWQGAFSTFAEYHAVGFGLGVGALAAAFDRPALVGFGIALALGEAQAQGGQLRDVSKEPVYAIVALAIGYGGVALIGPGAASG